SEVHGASANPRQAPQVEGAQAAGRMRRTPVDGWGVWAQVKARGRRDEAWVGDENSELAGITKHHEVSPVVKQDAVRQADDRGFVAGQLRSNRGVVRHGDVGDEDPAVSPAFGTETRSGGIHDLGVREAQAGVPQRSK